MTLQIYKKLSYCLRKSCRFIEKVLIYDIRVLLFLLGVSQGREQRGKDWDPEDPGAGRGGQCHHQSRELRVRLQGYKWHDS